MKTLLRDPFFFPLDFDFDGDEAVFVRTAPKDFQRRLRLSALDFPRNELVWLPVDQVLHAAPRNCANNTNFLLHLPFSGSTYLTRYLESTAVHLLRDPACIDAVFVRSSPRTPSNIDDLKHLVMSLLSRPPSNTSIVVRTAGYRAEIVHDLLNTTAYRSALFLYCTPESFLLQVLKSVKRRRDIRLLMQAQREFVINETGKDPALLIDAEIIALYWIYSVRKIVEAADHRLATLNCEALFSNSDQAIVKVAHWFGIDSSYLRLDMSNLQWVHAKDGRPFNPTAHNADIGRRRSLWAEDIQAAATLFAQTNSRDLIDQLVSMAI